MTSAVSLRTRSEGFSTSSTVSFPARVKRVWAYRRILNLLVRRDLKVRYAGSALGYLWTVLEPLLLSLVFWFIFTQVVPRNRIGYQPYILYLITGLSLWQWVQGGVPQTARALRAEAQMVRSSNVPRELWVIRTVMSKGIEYVFSLPVVVVFAIGYAKAPQVGILFLPLAVAMCFFLVLGLGLILAPLTVLIRDVDRVIPIVLRFMFYVSPIIYSINNVPKNIRPFFDWNPASGMLVLSRATFFGGDLRWGAVLGSSIVIAVIFVIGVVMFTRLERSVLKEI